MTPAVERRVRIDVTGTVQGVGFRPYVYRLARSLDLAGFVRNDSSGVAIEVQGGRVGVARFLETLLPHAPPHATIAQVVVADVEPSSDACTFVVAPSARGTRTTASIPADLATCPACVRELFDPENRRYRYPFINCTDCGPRFTIARGLPYDRAATTMAAFTMCDSCQREYDDPRNRRFHAQPNACSGCGPRATLLDGSGRRLDVEGTDAVAAAARALAQGAIVAVKGLGGYHLACRADDNEAVTRLRARKARDDKPFALMVQDVRAARAIARVGRTELTLLASAARPIVLLRARAATTASPMLAAQVAPGRRELGLMLPYTPIHHLLLAELDVPLVMTSGNRSDEPIVFRDDDAVRTLSSIVDLLLTHDRVIEARCDDSVVRAVRVSGASQPLFIRRARGYVPDPLPLTVATDAPVLAVGGQLKNTICVARGREAVVGPHAGDLGDSDAFAAWVHSVQHIERLADVTPEAIAYDAHPEYVSAKYAVERAELATCVVQHHHAHLAACLAEHGRVGPAIGVIFDGAGYGSDGTIWGGEILVGDLSACERIGHLHPVRMPGGEAAVREPWRMAAAWLAEAAGPDVSLCPALRGVVDDARWAAVVRLSRSSISPLTTSVGRLLDACAAICGIRSHVTYEGQAAIELEAVADRQAGDAYVIGVTTDASGSIVLDPRELILAVSQDARCQRDVALIAGRVHHGLVYAAALAAHMAVERTGVRTIVLSGGVFQNVFLLEALSAALGERGLEVLVPRHLPPNDGGLSYGQAAVATWQRSIDVSGRSRSGR